MPLHGSGSCFAGSVGEGLCGICFVSGIRRRFGAGICRGGLPDQGHLAGFGYHVFLESVRSGV